MRWTESKETWPQQCNRQAKCKLDAFFKSAAEIIFKAAIFSSSCGVPQRTTLVIIRQPPATPSSGSHFAALVDQVTLGRQEKVHALLSVPD
jgi:hypothetical protein